MKYTITIVAATIILLLIYAFHSVNESSLGNKKYDELIFEGKMGQAQILFDQNYSTIIVWFHPNCDHCRYQLDIINRNINRMQDVRFIFITGEKDFFEKNHSIDWPELVESSHSLFGIIDKSKFIDEFGPVITPSLLFFDYSGELKEKLYGEVKVDKIIQLINKHPLPERAMSGSN